MNALMLEGGRRRHLFNIALTVAILQQPSPVGSLLFWLQQGCLSAAA